MEKLLELLKKAKMDDPKLIAFAIGRFADDLLNDPEEKEIFEGKGYEIDEAALEKLINELKELSWEKK